MKTHRPASPTGHRRSGEPPAHIFVGSRQLAAIYRENRRQHLLQMMHRHRVRSGQHK